MAKTSRDPAVTDRLAEEHRELSKATQQLRTLASSKVTDQSLAAWRQDLRSRLQGFREVLLAHFEHEEKGGFLNDVLEEVPNAERKVEALRHEHADIARRLEVVLDDLARLERTEAAGRIGHQIQELTGILVDHESEEQHLLQRTYYREYGVGD